MGKRELLNWVSGTTLVVAGGLLIAIGLPIWLWAQIFDAAISMSTVQDVLFHYSVKPTHFRSFLMESVWRRILNTDLAWFAFATGTLMACVGAVPAHLAYKARSERLA